MTTRDGLHHDQVQLLEIDPEEAGQRVDNFLTRVLKGVPRSRVYRILRKGEVRVNRGRVRPTYRLQAGDQLRLPPIRVAQRPGPAPGGAAWLESCILYEDERLLVLNKPSGIAVHGGSGISRGIIESLRAQRPALPFLELVHRLDRDTSGCLMIAKRRSYLRTLHRYLREGRIRKTYLALLRGDLVQDLTVSAPLRKNQLRGGERMVCIDAGGKASATRFHPVEKFASATLTRVQLDTGRTHQIRVHAAHMGHPVAGDDKYGDALFNRAIRGLGGSRLFLHAQRLAFHDPDSGRKLDVEAPLGGDLAAVLQALASSDEPRMPPVPPGESRR